MDNALPTPNPELSLPEKQTVPLDRESGSVLESKNIEPVADSKERLATANDAVAQAVYGTVVQSHFPPANAPPAQQIPAATFIATPPLADDVPVIEKEWIQLAKEIVNRTKDDPRLQTIEIGSFKSDYVRKRFGKDTKNNEDATRTSA